MIPNPNLRKYFWVKSWNAKKEMVRDSPTEPENAPYAKTLSKPSLGRCEPSKLRPSILSQISFVNIIILTNIFK